MTLYLTNEVTADFGSQAGPACLVAFAERSAVVHSELYVRPHLVRPVAGYVASRQSSLLIAGLNVAPAASLHAAPAASLQDH